MWGVVTDEDLRSHSRNLAADPDFDPGYRQLADTRGISEFEVTASAVTEQSRVSPWTKGTMRAFVTARDDVYGMSRMFELLTDSGPNSFRVFRDMSKALEWLSLDDLE